jgi:hypothetical protein
MLRTGYIPGDHKGRPYGRMPYHIGSNVLQMFGKSLRNAYKMGTNRIEKILAAKKRSFWFMFLNALSREFRKI